MSMVVCAGGEVQFVSSLIADSVSTGTKVLSWVLSCICMGKLVLRDSRLEWFVCVCDGEGQVTWYTTMVGKKSTLGVALAQLQAAGVTCIRTTHLFQGHTVRWAVAWSFHASAQFSPYWMHAPESTPHRKFTVAVTGEAVAAQLCLYVNPLFVPLLLPP